MNVVGLSTKHGRFVALKAVYKYILWWTFICRGCTSADIGVNAKLELVVKFCYLGDMLSV